MKLKIKSILIFFVIIGLFYNLTGQTGEIGKKTMIAYYDALKLIRHVDSLQADGRVKFSTAGKEEIKEILKSYDMRNFQENPFIDLSNINVLVRKSEVEDETPPKSIEPVLVPKAASLILKFLVRQIKKDLAITFFTNFQEDFLSDKYEPLRVLFPLTYNQLKKIGGEIHNISSYINTLGDKFRMDFEQVYSNYPKLLRLKTGGFKDLLKDKPELKIVFTAALHLSDALIRTREHPGIILSEFNTAQFENDGNNEPLYANLKDSIQLLKIVSSSMRYEESRSKDDENEGRHWIHPGSLRLLFEKDEQNHLTTFKIYLGLLFQQGRDIEFLIKKNANKPVICKLKEVFEKTRQNSKKLEALKDIFEDFGYQLHYLDTLYNEINSQDGSDDESGRYDSGMEDIEYDSTYYRYFHTAIDTVKFTEAIFDYALDTCGKRKSMDLQQCYGPQKFLTLTRSFGETFIDIKKKDFNSVVLNTLAIFDQVFTEPGNKRTFKKNRKKILRYGSFMAKLVKAGDDYDSDEDAEEIKEKVEEAIKSVLPGSSYSHKRNSPFNISLNAYLGLTLSDEHLKKDTDKKILQNIDGVYVWAPLGVAVSTRTRIWFIGSASLFFSAIDLGAVAAFRFEGGDYEDIPQFNFKNIIAPGAHLVLGLKKLPISIGAGIQYGPQLRRIEVDEEDIKIFEPGAWRFNIFMALDIPIFNLK